MRDLQLPEGLLDMTRLVYTHAGWRIHAAALLCCAAFASPDATALDVALRYVGPADGSAQRGATQGLEEARVQGEFLDQRYMLESASPADTAKLSSATAIVADLPATALVALAAAHPSIPVFNVGADDDALRTVCRPNLFHVLPSASMRADAVAQWSRAHPDAHGVTAQAWHPDFEKYSASQLNKRYREAFAQPMDDRAWAGWAAVKLVSDLIAREQTGDGAKLLKSLHGDLAFDGQKGVDMSFRASGQLRQPLLLVDGGKIVGEAPVRGVVDIEDLDSLGPTACQPPSP